MWVRSFQLAKRLQSFFDKIIICNLKKLGLCTPALACGAFMK